MHRRLTRIDAAARKAVSVVRAGVATRKVAWGARSGAAIVTAAWMSRATMVTRKAAWTSDSQCHWDSRYVIDPVPYTTWTIREVTQGWPRLHTPCFSLHWFPQDFGYSLSKSSLSQLKAYGFHHSFLFFQSWQTGFSFVVGDKKV